MAATNATTFSVNNFDLIRLFAATQVALLHTLELLAPSLSDSIGLGPLRFFPGVPIFFVISGFLISRSFENSSDLKTYFANRALRIYPALHICLVVNISLVWATGYFEKSGITAAHVGLLFLAKATFLQFYNPDFMRGFGDGVLNGSLWTVCVELQFYLLVPITYHFFLNEDSRHDNLMLLLLILLSLACNRLLYSAHNDDTHSVYWKLLRVSFFPWFYLFATGVLLQRNRKLLIILARPTLFFSAILVYGIYASVMHTAGFKFDNSIGPWLTFPLAILIATAAYVFPTLSDRILAKNDVSYGVYIYHMVVVNMMLYYGLSGGWRHVVAAIGITFLSSWLSWALVERPSLRRKKRTLHALDQ